MNEFHAIKFETKTGTHEFHDVVEYVRGRKFLFIRTVRETLSFDMTHIFAMYRQHNGQWFQIKLRKDQ